LQQDPKALEENLIELNANRIEIRWHYLIMGIVYTASFGMLFFILNGNYWDGWWTLTYRNAPERVIDCFRQHGAGGSLCGYIHYIVIKLFGGHGFPYQVLIFITKAATMFLFYKCIILLELMLPLEALMLSLLFALNPADLSYIVSIMYPFQISLFLFTLSFLFTILAVQRTRTRDKYIFSGFSFLFAYCSYSINSLVPLELLRPVVLYFVLFSSIRNPQEKIKKVIVYWWPHLVGIIVFSFIRLFILPPYGEYHYYNKIHFLGKKFFYNYLSSIRYATLVVLFHSIQNFIQLPILITIGLIVLVFLFAYRLKEKKGQASRSYKISGFLAFSVLSLLLGMFAYNLTGKLPSYWGWWEIRHAVLSALGFSFLVFFILKYVTKGNTIIFYSSLLFLISIFGCTHIVSLIRYDIDSFKQRAVFRHLLEYHSKDSLEDTLLFFHDKAKIYDIGSRRYLYYEYDIPINYYLHTKNIIGVGNRQSIDWVRERVKDGVYKFHVITRKFPETQIDIMINQTNHKYSLIESNGKVQFLKYLKLKIYEIIKPDKFNAWIDKFINLEFSSKKPIDKAFKKPDSEVVIIKYRECLKL
jgi:hypothetical protein